MYRRIMNNYFQQRNQRNLTPVIQPNPSRMQRSPARAIQPNPSHMQSDQSNLSDFQEHQFNSSHAPHPNLPPPQHQQKQLVTLRRSSRITKIPERFREAN